MRLVCFALALIAITSAEARADRPRFAPTIAGGVQKASNDDTDGWITLGVVHRSTKGLAGPFWSLALDIDIGDGIATVTPTGRAGLMAFEGRDSGLYLFSFYVLGGFGLREFDGETDVVARTGIGLAMPPLLIIGAETRLGFPDILELTVDVGARETVAMVRVGWGI